jgi:prepilin peptidase CpaA
MTITNPAITVPLLAMLAAATVLDFREHRVPNGLTVGGALVGLLAQSTLPAGGGLVFGVLGLVVCLLSFLPFYVGGGMAAGDVKLMAAVGTFVGPWTGLLACAVSLVIGALIAGMSMRLGTELRVFGRAFLVPGGTARGRIPYAVAIALGAALVAVLPEPSILHRGVWA